MNFDPNKTPDYAICIPEYENEIWLLARKLGLKWEMLKSVMVDEVLYRKVHEVGFNSVTKSIVAEIFTERLGEYKNMSPQTRHEMGYKVWTTKSCIKLLTKADKAD